MTFSTTELLFLLLFVCELGRVLTYQTSGLALNTTQCEGVFDFSVNASRLSTVEKNLTFYDGMVETELDYLPVWLESSCKEAFRAVECMSVFADALGVDHCQSDCDARLTYCQSFFRLLKREHMISSYQHALHMCDSTSTESTCVSSGEVGSYAEDDPVCPLVCCFVNALYNFVSVHCLFVLFTACVV